MLLVIFGAGASYDSVPSYGVREVVDQRIPLTNGLFSLRFRDLIKRFDPMLPIVPYLQVLEGATSVEQKLEELQEQSATYPERQRQLLAVRYYVQTAVWTVDVRWHKLAAGVTNYRTLLDELVRVVRPNDPIPLVTFNYDRMLDWTLSEIGQRMVDLDDYTQHRVKLFKMHGSVNWGRRVQSPGLLATHQPFETMRRVLDNAEQLVLSNWYELIADQAPIHSVRGVAGVPALAIPLQRKQEFQLPERHHSELTRLLPMVTKILVIGWRATDAPFLELLSRGLANPVEILVVSPSTPADAGNRILGAGIQGSVDARQAGFSQFIVSGALASFAAHWN